MTAVKFLYSELLSQQRATTRCWYWELYASFSVRLLLRPYLHYRRCGGEAGRFTVSCKDVLSTVERSLCKQRYISYIPIYIQQDATLHSLFISGNCSTCFGWYFHPSSGAHTTVSTASGICGTVIFVCAPDDGWRYHPKHLEQFPDINKLCNAASCWIYVGIYLRCTDP